VSGASPLDLGRQNQSCDGQSHFSEASPSRGTVKRVGTRTVELCPISVAPLLFWVKELTKIFKDSCSAFKKEGCSMHT
jgi:hypothetical protein